MLPLLYFRTINSNPYQSQSIFPLHNLTQIAQHIKEPHRKHRVCINFCSVYVTCPSLPFLRRCFIAGQPVANLQQDMTNKTNRMAAPTLQSFPYRRLRRHRRWSHNPVRRCTNLAGIVFRSLPPPSASYSSHPGLYKTVQPVPSIYGSNRSSYTNPSPLPYTISRSQSQPATMAGGSNFPGSHFSSMRCRSSSKVVASEKRLCVHFPVRAGCGRLVGWRGGIRQTTSTKLKQSTSLRYLLLLAEREDV